MIRLATKADQFPLFELAKSEENPVLPSHMVSVRMRLHLNNDKRFYQFVAEQDSRIVASAHIHCYTTHSFYDTAEYTTGYYAPVTLFGGLFVHPEYRKQGLAKALTTARVEYVKEHKAAFLGHVIISSIRGAEVIGWPRYESRPAYHNLIAQGFKSTTKVDLVDGGPLLVWAPFGAIAYEHYPGR